MNLSCSFLGYTFFDTYTYKVQLVTIATILALLAGPTVLLNGCIMRAIYSKRELHNSTYCIIANLALSDCLSGFAAYIFYALVCIIFASGHDACPVAMIGTTLSYILGITTYNTIALQTIDRYVAVFYPFWYHDNWTVRNSLIGNTITWLLSFSLVGLWLITENNKLFNGILGTFSMVCLCVNIFCYFRVFKEVRSLEKQMQELQIHSYEERKKVRSESKVAKATAIILITVVICYTPLLFLEFYVIFFGRQTTFTAHALYWTWLLAMLSSLANPLISCRQLSVLRNAVKSQFRWLWRKQAVSPNDASRSRFSKTSQTDFNMSKKMSSIY